MENTDKKRLEFLKIAAIIIGSLIVIGLFGNIYLLTKKQTLTITQTVPNPIQIITTPTLDPKTPWQIYINSKFKFSILIPPGWSVGTDPSYRSDDIIRISKSFSGYIQIFALSQYPNLSPFEKSTIIINGAEVEKYDGFVDSDNRSVMEYLVKGEGKSYFTIQAHYKIGDIKSKELLEKIVKTFKFPN